MNSLPDELVLHLFTFIKVLSFELKPIIEINKRIRKILYYNKYTLFNYPWIHNESVASMCYGYLDFLNTIKKNKMNAKYNELSDEELNILINEDINYV
tara:strand:- start:646 stop:939 length:294 start_codon:yes stop_codon:yes gene_type:complete